MRTLLQGLKATLFLSILGMGSCSLHSGLTSQSYSSSDNSLSVGLGIVLLVSALIIGRKWFPTWLSWREHSVAKPAVQNLNVTTNAPDSKIELVPTEPLMLAAIPVYLWAQGAEPFKTWHSPHTFISHDMVDLFKLASHAYLFFVWREITLQQFGPEVSERIRMEQTERVNGLGNNMGDQLIGAVDHIEHLHRVSARNPLELAGAPGMTVPPILGVSLGILITWRDSPYYLAPTERDGRLPDFRGEDRALAECLAFCSDSGRAAFSKLLDVAVVDVRSLNHWVRTGASI